MAYLAGVGRADLTPPNPNGKHFFGWGLHQHVARRIAAPIYARALALAEKESGRRVVMVCLDLGCVTEAMRIEVMNRCRLAENGGLEEHELLLTATHTHSAPGGHSDYVLYALSCGGFDPETLELYVAGTVRAIREALESLEPAELRLASGEFAVDEPVAFNRSISAYNLNPDVIRRRRTERHLAVDRRMTLLRIDSPDGRPLAMWNWFAVHGTSIHSDYDVVHPDNKGEAAAMVEQEMRAQGHERYLAAFSQGPAGDVSPNFRYYLFKRNKRGCSRDDLESCRIHATFQAKQAQRLARQALESAPIAGPIDSVLEYQDFSNVRIERSRWGNNLRTGPAEIGIPQVRGTAEGLGISLPLLWFVKFYIRLHDWWKRRRAGERPACFCRIDPVQFNKVTLIASQKREMLGHGNLAKLPLPAWLDPVVATLCRWSKHPRLEERPFSPQRLPIQLVRIGPIAVAAVSSEFTTTSGRHLAASIRPVLEPQGVAEVLVQSYSNAYSSYTATPEEYELQRYEGGCTHFGKWTLAAYCHLFEQMARRWVRGERLAIEAPRRPSAEYLRLLQN